MSPEWLNLPLCERCWFRSHTQPPVKVAGGRALEHCTDCGSPTVAGIFIRVGAGTGAVPPRSFPALEPGELFYTLTDGSGVRQWVVDGAGTPQPGLERVVADVVEDL